MRVEEGQPFDIPIPFFIGYLITFNGLAWFGLALFAATVVFALVTLPVEFDAPLQAISTLLYYAFILMGRRD